MPITPKTVHVMSICSRRSSFVFLEQPVNDFHIFGLDANPKKNNTAAGASMNESPYPRFRRCEHAPDQIALAEQLPNSARVTQGQR